MNNQIYSGQTNVAEPIRERHAGRMHPQEAALALGFKDHDIPVLIRAGLLKALGTPSPNTVKYFAAVRIHELAHDEKWLGKATKAVNDHWSENNQKRRDKLAAQC